MRDTITAGSSRTLSTDRAVFKVSHYKVLRLARGYRILPYILCHAGRARPSFDKLPTTFATINTVNHRRLLTYIIILLAQNVRGRDTCTLYVSVLHKDNYAIRARYISSQLSTITANFCTYRYSEVRFTFPTYTKIDCKKSQKSQENL